MQKKTIKEREQEIFDFWKENNIFEKTKKPINPPLRFFRKKNFVFFDGPPFATGLPHHGSLMVGTLKDLILRYRGMQGYRVERQWGWDCHGLPVENEVEKKLNIKTKKDIVEKIGILKFNQTARELVLHYTKEWKETVERSGRFVDIDNAYRTMDSSYIESVWNIFNRIYQRGLAIESLSVLHICPRCDTPISNLEVALGYKDVSDYSSIVEFPIRGDRDKTSFLVWTTTPWTLPANTALAINKNFQYVKIFVNGKSYIVLEKLLPSLGLSEAKVVARMKGHMLLGVRYKPPFDYFYDKTHKTAWQIYHGNFVTDEEGTGIVHIAPAFGTDDFNLAKAYALPIIHHIHTTGQFTNKVIDFIGDFVKQKGNTTQTDKKICEFLDKKGFLFSSKLITHSYPHCWRCETPLINYAINSWLIKTTKIKNKLISQNRKINWVPSHIRDGRFGDWLENVRDWSISRHRFWGAPLPVWKNKDTKKILVISSIKELKKRSKPNNNLVLLRHAYAKHQEKKIVTTDPNNQYPLTEDGKEKTKQNAKKLKQHNIDIIISSPILRTVQTAEITAEVLGLPKENIIKDIRLKEMGLSPKLEGMSYEKFLNIIHTTKDLTTLTDLENKYSIAKRLLDLFAELHDKYQHKNILLVSHRAVLSIGDYLLKQNFEEKVNTLQEELSMYGQVFGKQQQTASAKSRFNNLGFVKHAYKHIPRNENFDIDLHRPYIDKVVLQDEVGDEYRHIGEVFDCWFESGMVPYASVHYPFKREGFSPVFNQKFPADFIAEGLDQTRGWFYSLLAVGVSAFGKTPYRSAICTGLILAEDGKKMSKSKQNYTKPEILFDKYGADAIRYYLMSSPIVRGENLIFNEKELSGVSRKILTRLHNCYLFFDIYKNKIISAEKPTSVLNLWILSRLYETEKLFRHYLDRGEVDRGVRQIGIFIEDFSIWFVRRSRAVLKEDTYKGAEARGVLRDVLFNLSKLVAPTLPFYAEYLYQQLKNKTDVESVHLCSWQYGGRINKKIIYKMNQLREITPLVLEERERANIKVRQPLQTLKIQKDLMPEGQEWNEILMDEINVLQIKRVNKMKGKFELDITITAELKQKGLIREFARQIQIARKEALCDANERVLVQIKTDKDSYGTISQMAGDLTPLTNARDISVMIAYGEYIDIEGYKCKIEIQK